uniref:Uncharacterized protein n=1 Tax=Rhizophora mucronata TaxID=61149 RepID=A0A2P2NXU0_RHIMU
MKCIPEQILVPICAWSLRWKACNLTVVPSHAATPNICYCEAVGCRTAD